MVTEQNPGGPSQNRPPPPRPLPASCLQKNFSFLGLTKFQRINLIREVRNAERKENSQARQNNNSLAINKVRKCRKKGKQSSKTK